MTNEQRRRELFDKISKNGWSALTKKETEEYHALHGDQPSWAGEPEEEPEHE